MNLPILIHELTIGFYIQSWPRCRKKNSNIYHLTQDIATYNKIFNRIHKVTLDYFTVNFSGRHSGRSFLLALQEEMSGLTPLSYDNHVLLALLHRLHFDVSEFIKYYPYAKVVSV